MKSTIGRRRCVRATRISMDRDHSAWAWHPRMFSSVSIRTAMAAVAARIAICRRRAARSHNKCHKCHHTGNAVIHAKAYDRWRSWTPDHRHTISIITRRPIRIPKRPCKIMLMVDWFAIFARLTISTLILIFFCEFKRVNRSLTRIVRKVFIILSFQIVGNWK